MRSGAAVGERTVMAEVEAAVNPDAVVGNGDVLLRIDGPLAGRGHVFGLGGRQSGRSVERAADS